MRFVQRTTGAGAARYPIGLRCSAGSSSVLLPPADDGCACAARPAKRAERVARRHVLGAECVSADLRYRNGDSEPPRGPLRQQTADAHHPRRRHAHSSSVGIHRHPHRRSGCPRTGRGNLPTRLSVWCATSSPATASRSSSEPSVPCSASASRVRSSLVPQFVQTPTGAGYGFGATATESGLFLLPLALTMLVSGPVAGRLGTRWGLRPTLVIACCIAAAGFALLAIGLAAPWAIATGAGVLGIGAGFAFSSIINLVVDVVRRARHQSSHRRKHHRPHVWWSHRRTSRRCHPLRLPSCQSPCCRRSLGTSLPSPSRPQPWLTARS